ncbi:hypothetical protein IFR05_005417 [Cadophora sp. M221]|nr:hypothetical protein IFR05_005417 [Cadophora sp. M221]
MESLYALNSDAFSMTAFKYLAFYKIGCIYERNEDFFIGADAETGLGPWNDEMEYYRALSKHAFAIANKYANPKVKDKVAFKEVPKLFERLMELLVENKPQEKSYGIANRNFGAHNLLVGDDFNIMCLTDFDCVMSAPTAAVARLPRQCSLYRDIPGQSAMEPSEKTTRIHQQLSKYRNLISLYEGFYAWDRGHTPQESRRLLFQTPQLLLRDWKNSGCMIAM